MKFDITGKRFENLLVLGVHSNGAKGKMRKWLCLCDCGNKIAVVTGNLTSGNTKSCGCRKAEKNKTNRLKHGHARRKEWGYGENTGEYTSWMAAKARCNNPDHHAYHNYGGRGIRMCDEWSVSFEAFLKHMGPRGDGLSLDRYPNNDGNYEPGNCRWATRTEQARNRRKRKLLAELKELSF